MTSVVSIEQFLRMDEDPVRMGRDELTVIAEPSVPFGLLHCTLYLDRNYAERYGGFVQSKKTQQSQVYYLGPGISRFQVRAAFASGSETLESNILYLDCRGGGAITVYVSLNDGALAIRDVA